jgi:hypothetical protein
MISIYFVLFCVIHLYNFFFYFFFFLLFFFLFMKSFFLILKLKLDNYRKLKKKSKINK